MDVEVAKGLLVTGREVTLVGLKLTENCEFDEDEDDGELIEG